MNDRESSLGKILERCKFISKKDEWFIEGTEVELLAMMTFPYKSPNDKIKDCSALMKGLTNETYKGYLGELPRMDEEGCSLDEFFIYDENGIDISEMTYQEYLIYERDIKIYNILK